MVSNNNNNKRYGWKITDKFPVNYRWLEFSLGEGGEGKMLMDSPTPVVLPTAVPAT